MVLTRRLAVLVGAAALASAGLGAAAGPAAGYARDTAPSAQDVSFLAAMHRSNLVEISAGSVAQQKAAGSVVRRLGADLIADHTRLDAAIRTVASDLDVSLPELPTATQRAQAAAVVAQDGSAFDMAWLRWQVAVHRQAMTATLTELSEGDNDAIVAVARRSSPVVLTGLLAFEQALDGGTPRGVNAGTGGQAARLPAGTVQAGWALLALGVALAILSAVLFGPRRRRVA